METGILILISLSLCQGGKIVPFHQGEMKEEEDIKYVQDYDDFVEI